MIKKFAMGIWLVQLALLGASCTSSGENSNQDTPALHARTESVRLTAIPDRFQAPGTIKAKIRTVLSSKIVGQITSLPFREGDRVRRGDVLVQVEGNDVSAQVRLAEAAETEARRSLEEAEVAIRAAEAGVRGAQANLEFAGSTLQRYEVLRQRKSVSLQEFDEANSRHKAALSELERAREGVAVAQARRLQALARIEQAAAQIEAAKAVMGHLQLTSPIDGIVTARHAEPGMLAAPGMPILAVEDDRTYQLECVIEESRAASVRLGQQAAVDIDAIAGTVNGRVSEIAASLDPATRTYTIKLDLALTPAMNRLVRSGFFGRAAFSAGSREGIVVPETAVVRRGQLTGVYVVREGASVLRLVKIGRSAEGGVEVLSGLNAGDRILAAPPSGLSDGVKIIEEEQTKGRVP